MKWETYPEVFSYTQPLISWSNCNQYDLQRSMLFYCNCPFKWSWNEKPVLWYFHTRSLLFPAVSMTSMFYRGVCDSVGIAHLSDIEMRKPIPWYFHAHSIFFPACSKCNQYVYRGVCNSIGIAHLTNLEVRKPVLWYFHPHSLLFPACSTCNQYLLQKGV